MTHLKLLTALTAFVLLTACGGGGGSKSEQVTPADCTAKPFAAFCLADTSALALRITACIADGNAAEGRCARLTPNAATNAAIVTCLTDPFGAACTASDFVFSTHADNAQANRVGFCTGAGNETNRLCPTLVRDCIVTPFDATCGVAAFESVKKSYCLDSDNHAEGSCVNAADWVDGFTTPLHHQAEKSNRPSRYEFLRGTANGLNNSDVRFNFKGSIVVPDIVTLTLETLGGDKKNGVAWFPGGTGSNAEPNLGFVAFNRLYAGIFSGTSLGAPLATADVSASVPWEGRIQWLWFENVVTTLPTHSAITNFHLTVDFANSEISGFVNRAGAAHFLLKAEFDDSGRFAGRITHGTFAGNDKDATPIHDTPGTLTGIIGKEGAVGAFISDQDHNFRIGSSSQVTYQAFVGGFVARPPTVAELTERARVEEARLQQIREEDIARMERERIAQELLDSQVTYTDWVEVTSPDTARADPLANQFLTGSDGDATVATHINNTNLSNATNGGTAFGGDATVGFQIFQGTNSVAEGTDTTNFYAGILTTTNLGAPLTENTAEGTWKGYLYAARVEDAEGDEQADFTPMVNFSTTTISATITGVTNFRGAAIVADTVSYDFTAMWDERGVFQSTINRTVAGATDDDDDVVSAGLLRGIIGQEGGIGIIHKNMPAELQASHVAKVKRFESGIVKDPITIPPKMTVR